MEKNGLKFLLNENDFTAQIINSPCAKGDIFIPKSINYESNDYIITSIQKNSFVNNEEIVSINFDENSEIRSIGENAFYHSSIKSISIPPSLEKLEEGWCRFALYLNDIFLSPNNNSYKYLDDNQKIVVGKSNPNEDNFDTLVFGCRDIDRLKIPSTIKYISSYAFSECRIKCFEYEGDSQLEIIGKGALNLSSVTHFYIPRTVKKLKDGFIFNNHSNSFQFSISSENCFFKYTDDGQFLLGKSDPTKDNYDTLIFAKSQNKSIVIPSSIEYISSFSFISCKSIQKVEFSEDSKLRRIGEKAFQGLLIETITLPSNVEEIKPAAFNFCKNLKEVNFSKNSKITSFCQNCFFCSKITSLTIPDTVTRLEEGWCNNVDSLIHVSLSPLNKHFTFLDEEQKIIVGKLSEKSDTFDCIVFSCRDVKRVVIPSSIKYVSSYAFEDCFDLTSVTFSDDSKLEKLGTNSFNCTMIETIRIPSSVTSIGSLCFANCWVLRSIEFLNDSELKSIGNNCFCNTSIEKIIIPQKVEKLYQNTFAKMPKLKEIEISPFNRYYYYHHQMLIDKTNSEIIYFFDESEVVQLPSCIEKIKSFTFAHCGILQTINFSKESKLTTICGYTFSQSLIVELFVPETVNYIGKGVFSLCERLRKVEFHPNSKLEYFSEDLFSSSSVEVISIPSKIKELRNNWCSNTEKLNQIILSSENKNFSYLDFEKKMIVGKSDLNDNIFDTLTFVCRNVKKVNIHFPLKFISSSALSNCQFKDFLVPKSVVEIQDFAFNYCLDLKNIFFEESDQKIKIGEYAFANTQIESLLIPARNVSICQNSLDFCSKLKVVELYGNDLLINFLNGENGIFLLSLPTATDVYIDLKSIHYYEELSIFTLHNSKITVC